jgi:hypothetical protein
MFSDELCERMSEGVAESVVRHKLSRDPRGGGPCAILHPREALAKQS